MSQIYTQEKCITAFKEFYILRKYVPTLTELEKKCKKLKLPSRKTLSNLFGSYKDFIDICELQYPVAHNLVKKDGAYISIYDDKDKLVSIVNDFIRVNNKIPLLRELNDEYNCELKKYYKRHFGSWNKCLQYLNLKLNLVSRYSDQELEYFFRDFVLKYSRVPSTRDFNNSEYPSFWVYQNRFGSWAKACFNYGYKPNHRDESFYMSDGEICDSTYEYDISTWLKSYNIQYSRNVNYTDFIDNYTGKMNCDYRFVLSDGVVWYVEMAGFINTYDFTKLKQRPEQIYYFKIRYKEKLLKRQNCNYLIISPSDLKSKSLGEIFYFLNIIEKENVF